MQRKRSFRREEDMSRDAGHLLMPVTNRGMRPYHVSTVARNGKTSEAALVTVVTKAMTLTDRPKWPSLA